jgi:hypothetical protein
LACGTFDGTVVGEARTLRVIAMAPHGEPGGTQGHTVVIDLLGGPGGSGMLVATGVESDDRGDVLGLDKG